MPEIAEVSRLVHFLRKHLVGRTIAKVQAVDDPNVFGKVGTSGKAFEAAMKGKEVKEASSQGKYFWLVVDGGIHPVMHLGMTGWIHIRNDRTAYTNYYKKMKPGEEEEWPPKYWKFQLETEGTPKVQVAFTDSRRFGRVRLVKCPGADIRQHSPLVENGPDPVIDKDIFTVEYLSTIMQKRRVPIKALILDQTVISGIGNWVADESLYHAELHPEQYCNDFDDNQMKKLHASIRYVCQTAVDKLANSDEFPDHWLFSHRWGKGKKGASDTLPNGEKLAFITVGGRTSCYAPGLQKKTGKVAPGIKEEPLDDGETDVKKQKRARSRKSEAAELDDDDEPPPKKSRANGKKAAARTENESFPPKKSRAKAKQDIAKTEKSPPPKQAKKGKSIDAEPESGIRHSGRLRKAE